MQIEQSGRVKWQSICLYAALMIACSSYFLLFFNRFAGIRSGCGEYVTGLEFLRGYLPYRDYFTTAPPLNTLKSALLLKVFGPTLLVSRLAGVAERLLLAGVLLHWLLKMFRPSSALVATVVTIILSAGDHTDPIASYNHDSLLLAVLSASCAAYLLRAGHDSSGRRWWAYASGALAALCLLTKQTVGLGETLGILFVMALLLFRLRGASDALRWCRDFLLGTLLPLAGVALALNRLHLLGACLHMLFIAGPAAKGGRLTDLIVREGVIGWQNWSWAVLGLTACAATYRYLISRATPFLKPTTRSTYLFGIWTVIAVWAVLSVAKVLTRAGWGGIGDSTKPAIYFTIVGLAVVLATQILRGLHSGLDRQEAERILFVTVSSIAVFMLSLSWPAFEAMIFPGLGFLLATILDRVQGRRHQLVLAVCGAMLLLQVSEKLALPFGFDGMDEMPVQAASAVSDQPALRGLRLPAPTVAFLDQTVHLASATTDRNDRMFTFPEMSLLYGLADRVPPTAAWSHNFDTANDRLASADAALLRQHPPKLIVYSRISAADLQAEERIWRKGRPAGQRDIIAAIEGLLPAYKLMGEYRLRPNEPIISVYERIH